MGILLSLVMLLGLMPGMSLMALAYDNNPYASLVNTTNTVTFNDKDWYVIADDSTAVNAGTVTLLAKNPLWLMIFHTTSNAYNGSTVQKYLAAQTDTAGSDFETVADAIALTDLDDVGVTGAKLYLLSKSEAGGLPVAIRKCDYAGDNDILWWLRTSALNNKVEGVDDQSGTVSNGGMQVVTGVEGVRPALRLDLSKVTFDSATKAFTLDTAPAEPAEPVTGTIGTNGSYTFENGVLTVSGSFSAENWWKEFFTYSS